MRRVVILWGVLIAAFLAFYVAFLPSHGRAANAAPVEFGSWAVPAFAFVFFVIFYALVRRQRGAFKVNNDAHTQLAEGRIVEALAGFEAARARMRNSLPLLNIGYAQLLLWRVADAAKTLEEAARKSTGLNGVPGGEKLAAPNAALASALLGDVAAAKRWIEKSPGTATAKLAGIVLAARAQDYAEAARLLRANDVVLDQLGGIMRALGETLAAYVASKGGTPGGRVDAARMFRESSVESLKPIWPELYDFVVRASVQVTPPPA